MEEPILLAQQYGKQESHYAVWASLNANLDSLLQLWEGREGHDILRHFVRDIFTTALDRVGWENQADDSDLQILQRVLLLGGAGSLGNERVIREAQQLFRDQLNGIPIEADKQELVFKLT